MNTNTDIDTSQYLLKASDIDEMEGELITHSLNPNAIRFNKSLGMRLACLKWGFT